MFTLATVILSTFSAAISSSTGATILHGPHHSAQKSTRTGLSLASTSVSKVASVTVLVVAPIAAPREGLGDCRNVAVVPDIPRMACLGRISLALVGQPPFGVEPGRTSGAGGRA